jgi:hypothetical protein
MGLHRGALRQKGALALLLAIACTSAQAIEITIPLPKFGANNYAECVIKKIDADTSPVEIQALRSDCRSKFPQASKRGMFGPRSVAACYNKNEHRVAHREAAKAIHGACEDYFQTEQTQQASAIRGSRLSASPQ